MRNIREVLRLTFDHPTLTQRAVAAACRISPSTVGSYLDRFEASGLSWPLPPDLDDHALEKRLFRLEPVETVSRPVPDWAHVHKELRRKHVTLALLWQEYRSANPHGYEYSWYCQTYSAWRSKVDPIMRQQHRLGEKCFVDYAGHTVAVIWNAETGEVRQAQIFVGVLGASNYSFVEASWSQDLQSWIGAHIRMFRFFGAVPEIVVCDNLKSGVSKPDFYEPEVNPTYLKMAEHYNVAILPTRVRKPRDKAKVEACVRFVGERVLAPMRDEVFPSLGELNETLSERMFAFNGQPFQKLAGSRRSVFLEQEKPCMRSLPDEPFLIGEWKRAKVHIDYHIEVEGCYYSVPHHLLGQQVEVFLTCATLEAFHAGLRVAVHRRCPQRGFTSTVKEHMPPRHRQLADWTPERIASWASKTGPATETMVTTIMASRAHPEQGFRACLGILRLANKFGSERLEAACRRAVEGRAFAYKSVFSILDKNLDQQARPKSLPASPAERAYHENIRGAAYYEQGELEE
ncbi:MAG: IS21 family transposase [Armatimonadetes bacterium]|nr:IS21 family transposase [Armatimonadota bacterium]